MSFGQFVYGSRLCVDCRQDVLKHKGDRCPEPPKPLSARGLRLKRTLRFALWHSANAQAWTRPQTA